MRALEFAICCVVFTACSAAADDIWFPPGDPGGKADAVSIISGSTIPSAYVDPTKSYLTSRRRDSLVSVQGLKGAERALADRIDGIFINLPSDGRLHVAELVRMEEPAVFGSLLPTEQAALPHLWPLLEAPQTDDGLIDPIGAFDIKDVSVPPAAEPVATATTQLVASRAPGVRLYMETIGPIRFDLTETVRFEESRKITAGVFTAPLVATQRRNAKLTGGPVLLINMDTGLEQVVFANASLPVTFQQGRFVFEVWTAGMRTFATRAKLPNLATIKEIKLDDKSDYALSWEGQPLVRNLEEATSSDGPYARYAYAFTTLPPTGTVDADVVTKLQSPTVTLAVGRYRVADRILEICSDRVVRVIGDDGTSLRLLPEPANGAPTVLRNDNTTFDTTTNVMMHPSFTSPITVTPAMREM
jgi:hypothetical protein